jgi:hypothetical protein
MEITGSGQSALLIGRERELAELRSALAAAREGRGRVYLIAGEPGIGKTRLAEAVADQGAADGMLPAWGRAWESAGAPAYWPWTQLLRGLVATRDRAMLEAEFGSQLRWLAQVLPELGDLSAADPPPAATSEKARFALFDAVGSFLHDVAAGEPLVLVLDDIHAADAASLLMLEFVARGVPDASILMLATFQEVAAHRRPEVERLVGALSRDSASITLRGFGDVELAQVVEVRTGQRWSPQLVDVLKQTTDGNPFFTTEVLRLVAGRPDSLLADTAGQVDFPLPETVREAVRRRFQPLGPPALKALETAAVIGREFRLTTVSKALDEELRGDLIALIDQGVAEGLVSEMPGSVGRFRFTHNLIRETLYSALSRAAKVDLHRAVGTAIEETYGDAPEHLVELAHHFTQASPVGDAGKALDYSQKAANAAMQLYAYEQAAELYGLALEMSELDRPDAKRRAELLLGLGRARARADHRGSRETLIEAGEAAIAAGEPRLLAEAALSMRAWPLGSGVLDDQPSRLLSQALKLLEGDDGSALRARVMARLAASLYYWPGTEGRRESLVLEALAIARGLGDHATLAHVLSNGQLATWGPYYTGRDLHWMEELLSLIEEMGGADDLELMTRNRQIDFLVELGNLTAADSALRALELTVGSSADPRAEGYAYLQRARFAVIEGRYTEAERLNARAVDVGERLRDTNMVILAANQVAGIRWEQGRLDAEAAQIREFTTQDVTPAWQAAVVRVACAEGNEDEARRALDRLAANDFADIPRYNGYLVTLALLAEACVELGDRARAQQLYELLSPFADRNVTTPQAVFAGPVERFLGVLAGISEEWDAAESHFDAARAAASRMNAAPVHVWVGLDHALMLARRDAPGDRDRALEMAAEARPLAVELDMDQVVQQIEALEQELGGAPGERPAAVAASTDEASVALLRSEGEFWTFALGGRSVRIRDSKGVRYISVLLAVPGVEVHAAELAGGGSGSDLRDGPEQGELDGIAADDAGPVLDAEAKQAYRNRLDELREEVEEADSFNDPERAAHAREEIDFLERELAAAVGLGGRDRKAASSAERARVSVTKAIRATIKRISEHDPILARELETTVRTGTFCVHEPDPRHPLEWRVHTG